MNVTIVGSHLCPNTLYALTKCKDAGLQVRFVDLSGSLSDLKRFLALHEHDALYAPYREQSGREGYAENGAIGLPCFLLEDGSKTLDLNRVLEQANQ